MFVVRALASIVLLLLLRVLLTGILLQILLLRSSQMLFLCRSGKVGIRSEERRVVVAHERDADRRHNRVVCVFLPGAFITCSDQHRLALLSAV